MNPNDSIHNLTNKLNPGSSLDQTLYNDEMINFKTKNKSSSWINLLLNQNKKPPVPPDCVDVSSWDIEKIQEFTDYINKNFNNGGIVIKTTNSNILENLENEKKRLEGMRTILLNDKRFGEGQRVPFSIEERNAEYNNIEQEIDKINNKISDEENKLFKMSRRIGGKSRTKQHYRNKSNKRKSKKSKRKSIKKTNNRK